MTAFVAWASSRPSRLILLAAIFAHPLAPVSVALLVIDALRRGPQAATLSTAIAILGLTALSLAFDTEWRSSVILTVPVILGGGAMGALLHGSRSLSITFQGTVVGVIVVTAAVFVVFPDAVLIGELLQNRMLRLLGALGAAPDQLQRVEAIELAESASVYLISLVTTLVAALMLGLWWFSLIADGVDFGAEFRALKLGRAAGIALMMVIILGQLVPVAPLQYLAPMAVIGFLFQGLAVVHARSYSDKWPRPVIWVFYIGLLNPWTLAVFMVVCAVGLLDNFFDLRARARPNG